eukprot:9481256-Pyramimonas_sp.AAC.2
MDIWPHFQGLTEGDGNRYGAHQGSDRSVLLRRWGLNVGQWMGVKVMAHHWCSVRDDLNAKFPILLSVGLSMSWLAW